ncbi:hypothetical protein FHW89_005547 [Mucilaginibacter sp. SG564]|nr:hypothetical protein [Mucilaginibacter sp. SG564]
MFKNGLKTFRNSSKNIGFNDFNKLQHRFEQF